MKKLKIDKWCKNVVSNEFYKCGNKRWSIARLIEISKDFEVFEIPLIGLNIYGMSPQINGMQEFVGRIKQVLDANLKYPIMLDDDGYVMDGRHRIAKALLEEKETIKAIRFEEMPEPCGYVKNKK